MIEKQGKDSASEFFVTSDIGIAAFLQLKGYRILECRKQSSGKFFFKFEDKDQTAPQSSIEFLESDFCKFDNNVRNLKKILFS